MHYYIPYTVGRRFPAIEQHRLKKVIVFCFSDLNIFIYIIFSDCTKIGTIRTVLIMQLMNYKFLLLYLSLINLSNTSYLL